ncbi:MAG: hypothetical protein AVDCRST_MAG79-1035 [uncultured Thermoleophilia bacterium]|uniref:Uncharacterized protein n=1 Tax=uncultured Thermoleophilia bacterium TaxID=1497501 RepID=A0A6J4TV29_9ACTN|nr:MAG: hypothetical protein AVDCRST_MAG79-1035 [uncultured Thermoleophilia bacterium]
MPAVVTLESNDAVPGRPFADPSRTGEDLATLRQIRAALVERVRTEPVGGTWVDRAGAAHLLVLPDAAALAVARPAHAVGFFGQARDEVDHAPIIRIEHDLLDRAASFPGLLAYHNVRFAEARWGNLVVFADDEAPSHVRGDALHLDAIARTGRHYRSVRLHRLVMPAGALADGPLELRRTAYHDFGEDPPWRALRWPAG